MKLSIVIPVYNEKNTIEEILEKVQQVHLANDLEKEIIIIDDCSIDGTKKILEKYSNGSNIKIIYKKNNGGKGSCLKIGFERATGDVIIIQDADLEYDPNDYNELLKPILDKKADVVFGSRLTSGKPRRMLYFTHFFGNKLLTFIADVLYNTTLSDIEVGYKVFTSNVLKALQFKTNKFDFEAEFTAKVLKAKYRIYEVPISYFGREYGEGKKIKWTDAFPAIYTLLKYRFFD